MTKSRRGGGLSFPAVIVADIDGTAPSGRYHYGHTADGAELLVKNSVVRKVVLSMEPSCQNFSCKKYQKLSTNIL
jgi:hypothetical protein